MFPGRLPSRTGGRKAGIYPNPEGLASCSSTEVTRLTQPSVNSVSHSTAQGPPDSLPEDNHRTALSAERGVVGHADEPDSSQFQTHARPPFPHPGPLLKLSAFFPAATLHWFQALPPPLCSRHETPAHFCLLEEAASLAPGRPLLLYTTESAPCRLGRWSSGVPGRRRSEHTAQRRGHPEVGMGG